MVTPENASKIIAEHLRDILVKCNYKSNNDAELILALVIKETSRALRVAVGDDSADKAISIAIDASKRSSEKDNPYSLTNLKRRGFTEAQILNAPEIIQ
ncbi:hypothetical protein GLP21_12095 [Photobacterium carnosum]|uniref:Uncharacterized protein n=1 Tax=Photobacterium carnosum TaxID=2023717 RepID=A0A2N4UW05_9GAMM|nr:MULTISPECIES: hypothetical protein [Photobacterium]MCD9475807.1 hypothetical protein [Photobacterium phosphoreum]MCD9485857.1 hypothetical protein [Photobacterium iliopiscarium]MCD9507668.1 hypothetical protein [Photobacterium phosphoreum]MCD9538211.1 hypothetical protein [Photobacterium carnosum]MCD9543015.1 hypothetical protein [Photobacterium carnosum]